MVISAVEGKIDSVHLFQFVYLYVEIHARFTSQNWFLPRRLLFLSSEARRGAARSGFTRCRPPHPFCISWLRWFNSANASKVHARAGSLIKAWLILTHRLAPRRFRSIHAHRRMRVRTLTQLSSHMDDKAYVKASIHASGWNLQTTISHSYLYIYISWHERAVMIIREKLSAESLWEIFHRERKRKGKRIVSERRLELTERNENATGECEDEGRGDMEKKRCAIITSHPCVFATFSFVSVFYFVDCRLSFLSLTLSLFFSLWKIELSLKLYNVDPCYFSSYRVSIIFDRRRSNVREAVRKSREIRAKQKLRAIRTIDRTNPGLVSPKRKLRLE